MSEPKLYCPQCGYGATPPAAQAQELGQLDEARDARDAAVELNKLLHEELDAARADCAAYRKVVQWVYDHAHDEVSEVDGSPETFAGKALYYADDALAGLAEIEKEQSNG